MPFRPIVDTAKVEIRQSLSGLPIVNVIHIRHILPQTAAQLTAKAITVAKAWDNRFRTTQSTDLQYVGVRATDLNSVSAPPSRSEHA